jgi:hypothetical protein
MNGRKGSERAEPRKSLFVLVALLTGLDVLLVCPAVRMLAALFAGFRRPLRIAFESSAARLAALAASAF